MTHLSVARHFYATQCSEEMVQMPHMSESAPLCQSLRTPLFQDESEFALNEEKKLSLSQIIIPSVKIAPNFLHWNYACSNHTGH